MALTDVIVIGAGTAGCVVAARLAGAGASVRLVELGPSWPGPGALTTLDATAAMTETDRFMNPVTVRRPGTDPLAYRVGRGVGGSSAINAMVVTAGDRADYDGWALDRHCPGLGSADLEPWLDRAAATMGITDASLGPLAAAMAEAAAGAGHQVGGPSLELDATGFRQASLTARAGRRRSAADGYLAAWARVAGGEGGGGRPGRVELITGAGVVRVVHRGGRARGVELDDGRRLEAGQIVLCAGALHSPAILAASGLHPAAGAAGMTSPVDGNGSGRPVLVGPVVDHPSYVFTVALRPDGRQSAGQPLPPISGLLRWSSPMAQGSVWSTRTVPADLMALAMDHVGVGPDGRRYGAVIVTLTDARSTGRLSIGADGSIDLDPGWLAEEIDRHRFRAGVRQIGQILGSGAFDDVVSAISLDDQGAPLAHLAAMTDDELDLWLRQHPGPVRHPAATLPMGAPGGPDAAVDPDGRLIGVDGLWVIDASALPHVPNANPMLPVLAVAERQVAGMVAGGAPASPGGG